MFRVHNKDVMNDVIDVVLVSLLLVLNIFYTFFSCFCRWLWTSKCFLGTTNRFTLNTIKIKTQRDTFDFFNSNFSVISLLTFSSFSLSFSWRKPWDEIRVIWFLLLWCTYQWIFLKTKTLRKFSKCHNLLQNLGYLK